MGNSEERRPDFPTPWKEVAVAACQQPVSLVKCPLCGEIGVSGEWILVDANTRETAVDLHCAACGARERTRIALPEGAAAFYPLERLPMVAEVIAKEFEKHKEFLLAPTVRRADGNLYMEPSLGIVKNVIFFRQLSDITAPSDTDAAAQSLPRLIVPPT